MDQPSSLEDLERAAANEPTNAQALVRLANAYWLDGRGPDMVGELASQAISLDPNNRGAWHLWALAEPTPRLRVSRWQQVADRFPTDQLARVNLADNAASLAGAEQDYDALALAIRTYEELRAVAARREEQDALDTAIRTLKAWRF